MANEITSTTTATDQEKMLAVRLLRRATLLLAAAGVCDYEKQREGTGLTAYFIRYERMEVPLTSASEGVVPGNSTFSPTQVTSTMSQWIDVVTLTDVAELTTFHPLLNTAIEQLSDNAMRVMDREIQLVWMTGTNVIYGDGSVTSRPSVTGSMVFNSTLIQRAKIILSGYGAQPRGAPSTSIILSNSAGSGAQMKGTGTRGIGSSSAQELEMGGAYVAICGPQPSAEIQTPAANFGTWVAVATYNDPEKVYRGEVGMIHGMKIVETNFIPQFQLLGNTTTAVASGAAFGTNTPVVTAVDGGGSLTSATTYYYKVTRKKKTRGFEEDISIEHTTASTATGNNESFTFNFSSLTSGYVYNLYFGASTGDANLGLVQANIAVGTTVTVTAVPALTTTPPPSVPTSPSTVVIHPVYIHGAESCKWVGLQDLRVYLSKMEATTHNPALQFRTIAYKFYGGCMIANQLFMLRCEVASTFPSYSTT